MAVDLERSTIIRALNSVNNDIGKAAKVLGCSRRTLQNRMREYGMAPGKPGRRKRLLPYGRRTSRLVSVVGVAAAAVGAVALGLKLRGGGKGA